MHPLLNPNGRYGEESLDSALDRYQGFGAELLPRLLDSEPHLAPYLRCFRDAGNRDIWAICDSPWGVFGVQLDPDIEVICLWDADGQEEIGTWAEDPVGVALARIREEYLDQRVTLLT